MPLRHRQDHQCERLWPGHGPLQDVVQALGLQPAHCKLLAGGPWFPGAPPLAIGILPPTTENWPDIIDAAPERKKTKKIRQLEWDYGKGREIGSQTEQKGIPE